MRRPEKSDIKIKEVIRRSADGGDLVCYRVVSGRGRRVYEHGDMVEREFAERVVAVLRFHSSVGGAIHRFDSSYFDEPETRRKARKQLVKEIRKAHKKAADRGFGR